jgi:hypothetical protein
MCIGAHIRSVSHIQTEKAVRPAEVREMILFREITSDNSEQNVLLTNDERLYRRLGESNLCIMIKWILYEK